MCLWLTLWKFYSIIEHCLTLFPDISLKAVSTLTQDSFSMPSHAKNVSATGTIAIALYPLISPYFVSLLLLVQIQLSTSPSVTIVCTEMTSLSCCQLSTTLITLASCRGRRCVGSTCLCWIQLCCRTWLAVGLRFGSRCSIFCTRSCQK